MLITDKEPCKYLQLISDKIQIIRFYLSLVRSVAYGESEVKLFACKEIINRCNFRSQKAKSGTILFNVKYLSLFHYFKAIYQFPKHIIGLVKIVANKNNNIFVRNDMDVNKHERHYTWT